MMTAFMPAVFGENMMDMFDDLDRNFLRNFDHMDRNLYGKRAPRMMKTDVKEMDDGYQLEMDLPGFKKDELHLELEKGYLTITAEKNLEKKEEKEGRVLRQERYMGTMQRSFFVGEYVTEDDVKASFENGVLKLNVPKKEALKQPEKKTILIAGE